MPWNLKKLFGFSPKRGSGEIAPDEIFLDSSNLPSYDTNQFEGRLEKPIPKRTLIIFSSFFLALILVFSYRAWSLQVVHGADYFDQSQNNHLHNTLIFSKRGAILDRNGTELAWNAPIPETDEFLGRKYTDLPGLAHVLGYVQAPSKDDSGFYYKDTFEGKDGVEKYFNDILEGENGAQIVETDALQKVKSASVVMAPKDGQDVHLTIDADLQSAIYGIISKTAHDVGYVGGAGVIMDVHTGEVLALTSFPEYSPQVLSDGTDRAAISGYLTDKNNPFLDRIVSGLYTPGSIVKPYVALGALTEGVISPDKKILSTGSISIPNPYDSKLTSVFKDWRPQGWINMRDALAVSSDVYFYEVGGGFQDQKGIGIQNIEKYTSMFGLGTYVGTGFFANSKGTIPSPEWKKENFNGDDWRIGDTYHTAIGQYGFQVAPIQMVRAVAAIANNGTLVVPSLTAPSPATLAEATGVPIEKDYLQIVREGMRQGVTSGISTGLNIPSVKVAVKTGTAELGTQKKFINSWITGFFPYDNPKYAFAIILEKGPSTTTTGGVFVMRQVLDWMTAHTPQYLQ